ncbi:MAG TPA: hypothetical protein VFX28_18095, partial [Methylomirabilota bacterium]|nr:hypothetical protein [Methylomirabilota bacterium]
PATTVSFFLSTDAAPGGDTFLLSRPVPALAPGAAVLVSATLTVPAGTAAGTYFVVATASAPNDANPGNGGGASGAVSVLPLMVRSTLAVVDGGLTGCTDPTLDFMDVGGFVLRITTQTGASFAGSAVATSLDGATPFVETFGLTGTVGATGAIAGALTVRATDGGVVVATGTGTFSGTATSTTLGATLAGFVRFAHGPTCTLTATLTSPP